MVPQLEALEDLQDSLEDWVAQPRSPSLPRWQHRLLLDSKHSLEVSNPPQRSRSPHRRSCKQHLLRLPTLSQVCSEVQLPQQHQD